MAGRYGDRYSFGLQVVGEEEAAALRCWNNVDGTEFGIADFERVGAVEGFVRGCGEPLVKELSRRNELSITQVCEPLSPISPLTTSLTRYFLHFILSLPYRLLSPLLISS